MLTLRSATRLVQIPSAGRIWSCAPSASAALLQQRYNSGSAGVFNTSRLEGKTAEVADKCSALQKENGFSNGKVVTIEADMMDRKSLDKVLDRTDGLGVDMPGQGPRPPEEDMDVMFQTNGGLLMHSEADPSPWLVPSDAVTCEAHEAAQHWLLRASNPTSAVGVTGLFTVFQLTSGSIYCATKSAVNSISGVLLRELVNTPIRVAEIQPGMVETEFSVVRYRGDKNRADNEYKGLTPRKLQVSSELTIVTGEDIAEEIVWVASRPEHVQIAQMPGQRDHQLEEAGVSDMS
ncbi:NADP(+)-dependent 3-hydroxy acid dehydrogenase [Trichosporon asahii var. asahii CBS 8904]|uniref:NADP(+)-dependent 3-hydroxy acid dehydrogenase n=1 Tax=Trichosporon asahii var. asahii (strain CBS 8904) TaxID=1220162 RepID=K1VS63_TRIAC|nr:NADP(+)-dependent 3-hydroxy acid dehydrogenase [Trichosporon asahii var. asahii CBS 8904]